MVEVIYQADKISIKEEVVIGKFLLTNKKGGYFLDCNDSLYRGFHMMYKEQDSTFNLFKTIDTISISRVCHSVVDNLYEVEKRYDHNIFENFFMYEDGLLYEINNYEGYCLITLDMRKIYDYSTKGHNYKIIEKDGFVIVEYIKEEQGVAKKNCLKKYLVLKGDFKLEKIENWVKKEFEFDRRRKTICEWFVFEAMKLKIEKGNKKVAFYSGDDLDDVMNKASYLYYSGEHLKKQSKKHVDLLIKNDLNTGKTIDIAHKFALRSLDNLLITHDGKPMLYAGLPWFFQVWSRDEAISLHAFTLEKNYSLVKEIVFRQIENILEDGRVENRYPPSKLGSADGVGWIFKRTFDLINRLIHENKLYEVLSREDLLLIKEKLKDSIDKLLKNHTRDGYAYNEAKETWMDTEHDGDVRDGARIEIQALRLRMYNFAAQLSKLLDENEDFKYYSDLEKNLRLNVRKNFLKHKRILCDGLDDATIRPNIFLCHYIYHELLSNKEWTIIFSDSLEKLMLDWGGLSTIDITNVLFCDEYTGSDNRSYHRGDSWFFINNIAAMCLKRVNYDKFYDIIERIFEASTNEILASGVIGTGSEISSAKEMRSEGCMSQAWSLATYIELVHELFEHVD